MTDNTLRTAIARALGAWIDEVDRPTFGGRQLHDKQIAAITDAVLAVLADPPEDVIERATEALRQDSYAVACPPWDSLTEEQKTGWLARGRHVLRAAFGGEQDG